MTNKLPNFSEPKWLFSLLLLAISVGLTAGGHHLFGQETPLEAPTPDKPATTEEPKPDATAKREASPAAIALLKQAREKIDSYVSVKADLVETVLFGPRTFKAEGNYLQGKGAQVRLEFRISLKGAGGEPLEGSMLQVCDGRILQTSHRIGEDHRVTRRDIEAIFKVAAENPSPGTELLAAKLGLGGIPSLLASLERSMLFTKLTQTEINGTTYQVIAGSWSDDYLDKFRRPDATETDEVVLPPYIPDGVQIYFDETTLFPRRVLYLKDTPQGNNRPLLALDFQNVQTNIPVDEKDDFYFFLDDSADVVIQDETQRMIQMIKTAAANIEKTPEKPQQ